jgi:hypothetical protein
VSNTTRTDIENLRKLLAASTPGPWKAENPHKIGTGTIVCYLYFGKQIPWDGKYIYQECLSVASERGLQDAQFIAAMRNATEGLLDELAAALKAKEEAVTQTVEQCAKVCIDMPQHDGSTYTFWPCVKAIRALAPSAGQRRDEKLRDMGIEPRPLLGQLAAIDAARKEKP